jgi:hypothetical protein
MGAWRNGAANFIEVRHHRLGIGARQNQSRGTGTLGTDCSEEISPFVALIAR